MSRAFIKEDVDPVERSPRRRSISGLPAGALNYVTPDGAEKLRARLERLREDPGSDAATIQFLEDVLNHAKIVEPSSDGDSVGFGALVTVEDSKGKREAFRVVGADEVDLDPRNVSWVSPVGKTLLAARQGQRVSLPDTATSLRTVISIDPMAGGAVVSDQVRKK